jgi:hypothetical protein
MQGQVDAICKKLHITLKEKQYRVGRFRLDAYGDDHNTKQLAVVELKSCMRTDALGQLLLYRRALQKEKNAFVVRSILVSTYIDFGLVEVMHELGAAAHGLELWLYSPPKEGSGDFDLCQVTINSVTTCQSCGIWDQAAPST